MDVEQEYKAENMSWEQREKAWSIGMEPDITRVVLADDHARVRAGIRYLLEGSPDIEVVGEASDGIEALELVEELQPDVLLLDMEMPRMSGSQVAARLQEEGSPVLVLVLSTYDDYQYILSLLARGAAGYITKDEAPEILVKAVRSVSRGTKGWVSKRIAQKLNARLRDMVSERVTLTHHELEVLRMLGASNNEQKIAEYLQISEETVQEHIDTLCTKFKVSSRAELLRQARRQKLI